MQETIYSNIWGAARGKQIVKLKNEHPFICVLTQDGRQAELLFKELALLTDGSYPISIYPEYAHEPFEEVRILNELAETRTLTLKQILEIPEGIVITTPYALLKKIAPKDIFTKSIFTLKKGMILPREELLEQLDRLGYLPVEVVSGSGEYCVRGGIVDLYPLGSPYPLRMEYFDDEIDYLFHYDVNTQKRIDEVEEAQLIPASELLMTTKELLEKELPPSIHEKVENFGKYAGHHWLISLVYNNPATLFDYMPDSSCVITLEENYGELIERMLVTAGDKEGESELPHPMQAFATAGEIKKYIQSHNPVAVVESAISESAVACTYRSVKARLAIEKGNLYHALSETLKVIKTMQEEKLHTVVAMESERFISLLKDFCRDHEIPLTEISNIREIKNANTLYLYTKRISGGFIDEKEHIACISDEEIFGFVRMRNRPKPKEAFSTTISDLEAGDYVVHIDYGIGIYKGLKHMVLGDIEGDYLEIIYENNEILYVPLEQISQIQKYIGVGDAKPRISSLQSTNWMKLKASARKQAAKIAQDLLKLYAERKNRKGFSFTGNEQAILEFEEHFQYDETEDQLTAIMDVYRDMEIDTPMERLVCGDVGFGKTEIAMRASFKAVMAGKQVAVLVPTTVLARQHYLTFTERFKHTPVNIDFVSRFRSPQEIKKVREKLPLGEIDIIIGTHRLLSKDIVYKDLGLLVIDEEQRFGVAHKEKIAAMRSNIDVLSLSATPIPRTLQLSLSGIRNISVIETPPSNRLPVAMKVIRKGDEVKKAVTMELERGGQVFFLHNRIKDISEVADELRQLVPHARIAAAHGQTTNKELENILKQFYDGDIDVLVATTIIENGIDIPNVNAIIINNAANFGLSQLYQLKGRVGRGGRRAYCYLLVENFSSLTPVAKKRLSIIQQLSELGSGLKIAMYDLQLRGAGDILGAQQSGFVTKVGYELFIKMISEAVARMQEIDQKTTETEIITQYPHYISAEYIEDPRIRLDYYRIFASITDRAAMHELFDELYSQYGELKKETIQLGHIMLIKNIAGSVGITKAGIYSKMLSLSFCKTAGINPEKITGIAERMKLKYRFAGEYDFVIAFEFEEQTLASALTYLELLSAKEEADE